MVSVTVNQTHSEPDKDGNYNTWKEWTKGRKMMIFLRILTGDELTTALKATEDDTWFWSNKNWENYIISFVKLIHKILHFLWI